MKIKAEFLYLEAGGVESYLEKKVESKRIVCSRCNGDGTHVNPNIDGNGITSDEMDELGDDFRENYLKGVYDVRCQECKGNKVLDVVDVNLLNDEDKKAYYRQIDEINQNEADAAHERRMGC